MPGREPDAVFVLIHSPLVGPKTKTWSRVADELERRGRERVVPSLLGVADVRLRAALEGELPRLPLSYFDASVPLPHGTSRARRRHMSGGSVIASPSQARTSDARSAAYPGGVW